MVIIENEGWWLQFIGVTHELWPTLVRLDGGGVRDAVADTVLQPHRAHWLWGSGFLADGSMGYSSGLIERSTNKGTRITRMAFEGGTPADMAQRTRHCRCAIW